MTDKDVTIHPTAIIAQGARLGAGVSVGAFTTIGENVEINDNTKILSHVVIDGHTKIGQHCEVFPFTTLGLAPQHSKYEGEPSRLVIGNHNIIREHVSMHGGTALDRMETTIGEHGLFMAGSHVAHDCVVGDHAILANGTGIAGHVSLGDHVYLGGYSAVHPFVRIGSHVIVGGGSIIVDDIIPFGAVVGARAMLDGLNIIGLRRRGFTAAQISALRAAYNTLFVVETGLFSERLESLKTADSEDVVDLLVKFIETKGKRPLCHPER